MNIKKTHAHFGGEVRFYSHDSEVTKTPMSFSVFLPNPNVAPSSAIIWLSGLTCTEENFITKSGIGSLLSDTDTMIICPDTSPRGLDLPGEHESYDFGSGAGFYLNATTQGYKDHYKMYDYVNDELFSLLVDEFKVSSDQISIMGHSMGGHGALVLGLNNPNKYKAISAFSPIVNPSACPWGQKAFTGYLGSDESTWKQYDACELVSSGKKHHNPILIDQGEADEFLENQLLTENFIKACKENAQALEVNMRPDYDHSYYFISSFLKNHIDFHLQYFN